MTKKSTSPRTSQELTTTLSNHNPIAVGEKLCQQPSSSKLINLQTHDYSKERTWRLSHSAAETVSRKRPQDLRVESDATVHKLERKPIFSTERFCICIANSYDTKISLILHSQEFLSYLQDPKYTKSNKFNGG